ncbi:MAG: serine/threonine protein kinase, partial [Terriglobales bacterium]
MQPPDVPDEKIATPEEATLVVDETLPSRDVGRGFESTTQRIHGDIENLQELSTRMAGRILNDHFEIIALVAQGGMSYVYRAKDMALKKIVAVKMLRPHLLQQPNSIRRLRQEAMATSTLDHPNTVGVRHFDVTAEGEPYLVMDFLEGRSLAQILTEDGRMETTRAVKVLQQMAQALASAHAKGIVHRDLKASNVLLVTAEGTPDFVKIIDFGIAKVAAPDESDVTSNLTMTGEIFGSPLAMSPEQCRGEKVDHRSDIYSFGCLMYQMLTGKPVFQAKTTLDVLFKQLHEMPDSFKDVCPEAKIPPQLEAIAIKALQKNPKQRYQSMQELADDLQSTDKTSMLDLALVKFGLATKNQKRNRLLAALAVAFTLAAAGAGIGLYTTH